MLSFELCLDSILSLLESLNAPVKSLTPSCDALGRKILLETATSASYKLFLLCFECDNDNPLLFRTHNYPYERIETFLTLYHICFVRLCIQRVLNHEARTGIFTALSRLQSLYGSTNMQNASTIHSHHKVMEAPVSYCCNGSSTILSWLCLARDSGDVIPFLLHILNSSWKSSKDHFKISMWIEL